MSALRRRGHLVFRLHQKRIASQEVIDFLRQMLKHHPRRHLVSGHGPGTAAHFPENAALHRQPTTIAHISSTELFPGLEPG